MYIPLSDPVKSKTIVCFHMKPRMRSPYFSVSQLQWWLDGSQMYATLRNAKRRKYKSNFDFLCVIYVSLWYFLFQMLSPFLYRNSGLCVVLICIFYVSHKETCVKCSAGWKYQGRKMGAMCWVDLYAVFMSRMGGKWRGKINRDL